MTRQARREERNERKKKFGTVFLTSQLKEKIDNYNQCENCNCGRCRQEGGEHNGMRYPLSFAEFENNFNAIASFIHYYNSLSFYLSCNTYKLRFIMTCLSFLFCGGRKRGILKGKEGIAYSLLLMSISLGLMHMFYRLFSIFNVSLA